MATKDTHFSFNDKLYQQSNGVAMGSPLAPIIADIFMIHLEEHLLPSLKAAGVGPYKHYVDDTFLLIDDTTDIVQIKSILNNFHKDIKFTSALEENKQLSFLDVLITRHDKSFNTSVYCKATFSGLLTKWNLYVPRSYKVSAISNMIYRAVKICSTYESMHQEFEFIRKTSLKSGCPTEFIEGQIRNTLNRFYKNKNKNASKKIREINADTNKKIKSLFINVPYIGGYT